MNPQNTQSQFIRHNVLDGVAEIVFDRPHKLNAFDRAMAATLIAMLERIDTDDAVRVTLITGSGRAFCAGADLTASDSIFTGAASTVAAEATIAGTQSGAAPPYVTPDVGGLITLRMYEALKPIIVAFNGVAVGMGVTISLAADVRIASTSASFSLPFTRRGIVPESASSWFLPRIVGIGRALEWILTGRTFSAAEALAAGLVHSLHEPQELLPAARALAREIVDNAAPVSVAASRQLLWKMLGADHPLEAHELESRAICERVRSEDVREGVSSFLEKRSAKFVDRVSLHMPKCYPWRK